MELAERLNLITGDNGLGKSFLLDVIWWALTRKWPADLNPRLTSGYPARPTDPKEPATIAFKIDSKARKNSSYASTYVPRDEAWLGKAGRPPNPGLVIYAHSDGGFSVWDPARNYWKKKGNIDIQERLPGFVFSPQEVWEGLRIPIDGKSTVVCNGLLTDWAGWIREKGDYVKTMQYILKALSPPGEAISIGPLTRISINDARDIPSITTPYSQAVPVLHASSGIRRIIGLAYMLNWSWSEHAIAAKLLGEERTKQVIILFDEIESHLHPKWQRRILKSVLDIAQIMHRKAKIQLIATTHSPLILASAETLFNNTTDGWHDLDLEPDGVKLRKRLYVPRGEITNWLTSEAFDLKRGRSSEGESAIEAALALLREEAPQLPAILKVDKKLREAHLPDIDPFWIRWSKFVDEARLSK